MNTAYLIYQAERTTTRPPSSERSTPPTPSWPRH